jgi:5-methylcytosine-specific restriction endonuclease McrA
LWIKTCEVCRKPKADDDFLAGKARKPSRACAACRKALQRRRIKNFYAKLSPDERNTLTMRRRANAYGVATEAYSRTEIMARWDWTCAYCASRAEHLDHVSPLSRGGEDVPANLLPACADCNLRKGAKTLAEWALANFGDATPF